MRPELVVSRRELMRLGAAAVETLALPAPASAGGTAIDPYIIAAPLVFPLADGGFQAPLQNNWHGLREGKLYPWNHRGSTALRDHDGVDVYPSGNGHLPTVFAPLQGTVAAVCTRSDNTLQAQVTYRASAKTPPWDYHHAIDDVAQEKRLTSLDSYASLLLAAPRHATVTPPTTMPISVEHPATGTLAGQSGGAFAAYALADPGSADRTVTLSYGTFDAGQARAIGLNIYQGGIKLGSGSGRATGLGDRTNSSTVRLTARTSGSAGDLLLQVFNYSSRVVTYSPAIA